MSVNFEYYKIFYYVAKYKSITQAASLLYSSQPSISRMIKILEQELGCTLFIRTRKGVALTPEGEELFDHVAPACEELFVGEELLSRSYGLREIRSASVQAKLPFAVFFLKSWSFSIRNIRLSS